VKSGDKLQKLVTLLVTWGLLLVLFVGYEMYFVRGQEHFLQTNGFRSLASLANQLNAKFAKVRASTESFVRLLPEPNISAEGRTTYLRLYLDGPSVISDEKDLKRCTTDNPFDRGHVPLAFVPHEMKLLLSVYCFAKLANGDPSNEQIPLYRVDIRSLLTDSFQGTGDFDDVLVADESGHVMYESATSGPHIANVAALIPSNSSAYPSSVETDTPSAKEEKSAQSSASGKKKPAAEKSGGDDGKTNPDTLSGASSVIKVTYAGRTYQLFSQPVRIWLSLSPNTGTLLRLSVYGLWDDERFEEASRKVPYSNLIWAGLVVVALLGLTWPLFKLRYMGRNERFGPGDGWLLLLAVSLASASVTLMLLNASYTAHAKDEVDQRMARLAKQIKLKVRLELDAASNQIKSFGSGIPDRLLQQSLAPSYLKDNPSRLDYSFFDSASWLDCTGQQVAKVDMRAAPTPTISVGTRPYFRRVIDDLKEKGRASEPQSKAGSEQDICKQAFNAPVATPAHLEPVLSVNTDEFVTLMSGPFSAANVKEVKEKEKRIRVAAMNFRPLSLVDPVLPPGYRFAVLNRDCKVLFHSDSFRDLRENFCEESKDQNELQPWLFAGVDTPLDISYQGHPVRAYITALDTHLFVGGQPFLVVFREPDVDLTLNLAIILVSAVLLSTYFAVWVTAATTYLLLRQPLGLIYPPRSLWPQHKNGLSYVQLFAANVALTVFFWFAYTRLFEAPLIALTMIIALVAVLLAGFKLIPRQHGPLVLGSSLTCVTITLGLLLYCYKHLEEWNLVLVALAGSTLIALLLDESVSSPLAAFVSSVISKAARWIIARRLARARHRSSRRTGAWIGARLSSDGWLKKSAEKHFALVYTLAMLSMITSTVLVPCFGSFKYAYDALSELSLKHDELVLSQKLSKRRARILQYYDKDVIASQAVVYDRILSRLDRYDSPSDTCELPERPFFAVGGLTFGDADCPSSVVPEPQGLNDVLERWMAAATLRFPANTLGREMSKLGVAATANPNYEGYGYTWKESTPTTFKLSWTVQSELYPLNVTSTYLSWAGVSRMECFLLIVLWIALSFWFMTIVNNILFATIEDTSLETVGWEKVDDIKRNYLVIERAKSGRTQWLGAISGLTAESHLDLRVELQNIIDSKSTDSVSAGSIVILDYFEFNFRDRKYNLARLELLEKLLLDPNRKLVLVSTIDPLFFLTDSAPEVLTESANAADRSHLLDRWAHVLARFTKVHPKAPSDRDFHRTLQSFDELQKPIKGRQNCHQLALWIEQECNCTTHLRRIGQDLVEQYREEDCDRSRDWVVSKVLDMADSYYHVLWSTLTASERLVLYQLAMDGWTNPKNIAAILQLKRKLLVFRDPMYRIMNESFRRFVLSSEHADEIAQWEKAEQTSTWRAFRFGGVAVVIGVGVWLLYTQAAFSQIVVAYIAAITTLLTAIAGLFGKSSGRANSAQGD
jgi:hypothetical protein